MKNTFGVAFGIAIGTALYQLIFHSLDGVDFIKIIFIGIFSFLGLWISNTLKTTMQEKA